MSAPREPWRSTVRHRSGASPVSQAESPQRSAASYDVTGRGRAPADGRVDAALRAAAARRIAKLIAGLAGRSPARVLGEQEIRGSSSWRATASARRRRAGRSARRCPRSAERAPDATRAPDGPRGHRPRHALGSLADRHAPARSSRRRRRARAPSCPGPTRSATTPPRCATAARLRARTVIGEIANLRPPTRARAYFELRDADGAIPCAMWRNDWDRLGALTATLADGVAGDRRRRLRLLPRQRERLARLQLLGLGAARGRRGRPARADRARAAARSPPTGLLDRQRALPRALLPRTIGIICGETGKAPRGCRSPGWRGAAGRAGSSGRSPGSGPPRGAADRRRAARHRRARRGRGDRRRPRRRLADRPARLLRRAALPHGRAAAGAGDRLDRPPHRPHAARRGRRGELLDPDARRRGGRAAQLHRRARRAAAAPPAGCAPTPATGSSRALACSPRSRGPPPRTSRATAAASTRAARAAGRLAPPGHRRARASGQPRAGRSRAAATAPPATAPSGAGASSNGCAWRSPPTTRSGRWRAATPWSRTPPASRSRPRSAARSAGRVALRFADDSVAARIEPR